MTPQRQLEDAIRTSHNRLEDLRQALEDDADAEHEYKTTKAKEFLKAEGTEKARDATSVVNTEKLLKEHLKKRALKEFTRAKLEDARNAQSAMQTLASADAKSNFGASSIGA